MDFLKKFKEFNKQIKNVERNIYSEKQDFIEIYERNLELEKEIAQRTKELDVANERMLSLQHILDMMNSSKPLSSVLDTIVNSLQGELGYLHSCILQKKEDEHGEYLKIVAQSNDYLNKTLNEMLPSYFDSLRMAYNPEGAVAEIFKTKEIFKSTNLRGGLQAALPGLDTPLIEEILTKVHCKSYILVPLSTNKGDFGAFLVLSSREEVTDSEINFLSLFAKQIEVAVTIADLFQAVKEQAVTDGLTGLYNRRYFEECIQKEFIRSQRQNQPLTVIGIDLDHLKQINDTYGHSFGDIAIKTVAEVLKKNARSIDIPARMGGEEFNVLLPGVDSKGGMIAAERIRKAIEDSKLDTIGTITASIGVATMFEHSENLEELLELTDQAMYNSKRNGRNQVTLAKPASETSWQETAINAFVDILSKQRIPIEKTLSADLCKKLEDMNSPKEILYSVADILAKTYNPLADQGITKNKVLLATSLAKRFDLSKAETDNLRIATLLYDIGNLMLPTQILQKREPLTDDEHKHIKEHPVIAARDILRPISTIQDVIPIIEHHHENWDGSGYPNHISGENIPIESQIILIVDAYFAMTQKRAYRPALSSNDALEAIKKDSGKKWNEKLVQEFVTIINSEQHI